MTINIKKAIKLAKALEAKKDKLAKLRDEMRDLVDEYDDILDSVKDADSDFTNALESLNVGIDSLSQYL